MKHLIHKLFKRHEQTTHSEDQQESPDGSQKLKTLRDSGFEENDTTLKSNVHDKVKAPVQGNVKTLADLQKTIRLSLSDMISAVKEARSDEAHSSSLPQKKKTPKRHTNLEDNNLIDTCVDAARESDFVSKEFDGREEPLNIAPTETPLIREHNIEDDFAEYPTSSKFIASFIGIACLALLFAVTFGAYRIFTIPDSSETATSRSVETERKRPTTTLGDTIAAAKKFLNAQSQADLLEIIRHPEIVGPIIQSHYKEKAPNFSNFTLDTQNYYTSKASDTTAVVFIVRDEFLRKRALCTMVKEHTEPKVDWESFVNYSEIEWKHLLKKRPVSPTLIRSIIEPGTYYNSLYQDDQWQCFRMSDNGTNEAFYAYAKKDSFTARQAVKQLEKAPDPKRPAATGIFRIFFEDGARPNQARLDEVVNFGLVRQYR